MCCPPLPVAFFCGELVAMEETQVMRVISNLIHSSLNADHEQLLSELQHVGHIIAEIKDLNQTFIMLTPTLLKAIKEFCTREASLVASSILLELSERTLFCKYLPPVTLTLQVLLSLLILWMCCTSSQLVLAIPNFNPIFVRYCLVWLPKQ